MNSKDQFIANKNLSAWWGTIAGDSRFDSVLLHAGGMALEGMASQEQRDGALKFKEILLTMAIPEAAPVSFTKPGLHHNLDEPRKTAEAPKTDEAPKPKEPTKKKR